MNSRLEALVRRGYPRELVMRLASFTDKELDYASKRAFEHISRDCKNVNNPQAIFIGGQPGCGKTILSMELKNSIGNAIEIGIDNYRMYHPRYIEIEDCIREFWKNKSESVNDSPGNDIADFTHLFAGAMTDKLIEMGRYNRYNMLLEWGMREPTGPLKCMDELKKNGYNNMVVFVCTDKELSYNACNLRADIMKGSNHIIRKVPKSFHDFCVETLPSSIDKIYLDGKKDNLIDYMSLVTRNGKTIWDINNKELPGKIYVDYVNKGHIYSNNNSTLAKLTTKKEMIGLKKELEEVIVYFTDMVNTTNTKGNVL